MPAIQIASELYEQMQARAAEAGFASVDAYVADLLESEVMDAAAADALFPPERLAALDATVAELDAGGKVLTQDQIDESLRALRQAWESRPAR